MSGWDNFGDSGRKAYWDASLNIFKFNQFAGLDVEIRIVTETPFNFSTHWYYRDLEDAYLQKHDLEGLKAKYGGRLTGKNGPKQRSFECCDFDSESKTSRREHCLLCTTYEDFAPWPNKTSLVQAFWRIPASPNPQLHRWQNELRTFSFNKAAAKKLGTVIRQKGGNIHDVSKGYTVLVTYNANSGADTWNVAFGERFPLPPSMQAFAKKSFIDFATLYQPGDPAELERDLNKIGYPSLLDGSYVPGQEAPPAGRGASQGRAQAGRPAAQAQGRRAAPAPVDDFGEDAVTEDLGGFDADTGAGDFGAEGFDGDAGFDADAGDFGAEGFDPTGSTGDDFDVPGDEFEPEPVAPARQAARPAPPRSSAAPARPAAPPPRQAAPARPAAPAGRPAAPPQRQAAPARPAAPPTRPAAPPQRSSAAPARPGAPRPGYGR